MEYVTKFLSVEGVIGQGAFGRVLVTSPLQNQQAQLPQIQISSLANGSIHSPKLNNTENSHQKSAPDAVATAPPTMAGMTGGWQLAVPRNQSKGNSPQTAFPTNNRFALKCVHPLLKPQRLANELRHLRDLGGMCNVVQMHTAYLYNGSLYIVMELIEHDRFLDVVALLDQDEIKLYIQNLLIALQHVHAKGIMHRDIKPGNFLFNRKERKFLLVDFGLAQSVRALPPTQEQVAAYHNRTQPATPNIQLRVQPKTPTSSTIRRQPFLFPELHTPDHKRGIHSNLQNDLIKAKSPLFNFKTNPNNLVKKDQTCHFIHLDTKKSTDETPNIPTKRQLPNAITAKNDFNQMLKKLRVSNNDEPKEPVKLTVGAYESPVTHNDSLLRRTAIPKPQKFSTPDPTNRRTAHPRCDCRGKPRTCNNCLTRPESTAPKSGTPGFKAPEILLRSYNQTTAIDIWSAGVILACLLAGHYPFFRDSEDTLALAEIISIFGTQSITEAARTLGIRLTMEPKREPMNLVHLCKLIRQSSGDKRQLEIPDIAFDLLYRMMDPNPKTRISAEDALKHPWLAPLTDV